MDNGSAKPPIAATSAVDRPDNDDNIGNTAVATNLASRLGKHVKYGCTHYSRRCKIRAPCCGEVFDCRHCHNEVKNVKEKDPAKCHDLPRSEVEKVICTVCNTEQKVQQVCENCGVVMGEYFCGICKFFDDDTSKKQFHCKFCGICRVGGQENFAHCQRCGCCYGINMIEQGHVCVENSMHHNCPVCFEYLFDSVKDIAVLPCGHTLHSECFKELRAHFQYTCPVCSKSIADMSGIWNQMDQQVSETPMPEIYRNKMVRVLCNDCGANCNVNFHIIAHKCTACNSYNTRRI